MPKPLNPKESRERPLPPEQRDLLQLLLSHPMDFPPEFWAAVKGHLEVDPPSFMPSSVANLEGEAWKEIGAGGMPGFSSSWVNFDTLRKARFCKNALGWVELGGVIKSGTVGQKAFTLPAGYCPAYADASNPLSFAVNSNGAFGTVDVYGDGVVIPAIGNNAFFFLDGIHFRAI